MPHPQRSEEYPFVSAAGVEEKLVAADAQSSRGDVLSMEALLLRIKSLQHKQEQQFESMKSHWMSHEQFLREELDDLSSKLLHGLGQGKTGESVGEGGAPASATTVEETSAPQEASNEDLVTTTSQQLEVIHRMEHHDRQDTLQRIMEETVMEQKENEQIDRRWLTRKAHALIVRPAFEYFVAVIIASNAVVIGAEAEMSLQGHASDWIPIMEWLYLLMYSTELSLRYVAKGHKALYDNWFRFDACIVFVGYVGKLLSAFNATNVTDWWQQILLIRMFRMLRLVRALRMIKLFSQMWNLVYGLLTSMNTMISTLGLLVLTLYIFACVGVDLITRDELLLTHDSTAHIVEYNFGNLWRTMLTLMQFVTMDSVAAVYMPIIVLRPALAVYFILVLLFISIALMNLVTVALVEGALENAAKDKLQEDRALKAKMKTILPVIIDVFKQIDGDGSGYITLEEMEKVTIGHLPKELADKVSVESMKELFEVLDVDGGGYLTQEEFVQGLLHISLLEVSLPTVQILKLAKSIKKMVSGLHDQIDAIGAEWK